MKSYDVIIIGAGMGGLSAATKLALSGKRVLVLEKHNLPGGCATSFRRGRFEFEASLHEMCQMGKGEFNGAVRQVVEEYGLDVEWVSVNEAFNSVCTDPENGFSVSLPTGVQNFLDEMERLVPGSYRSMSTVLELGRMLSEGVGWLRAHNNEPGAAAKVSMLLKYHDLMKVVPVTVEDMLDRIGVPEKAKRIYESYWDYIAADSSKMSFAVYTFMVYTYLTQKPHIARLRSHEISLAFDRRIRELGGEIWYNCPVKKINVDNSAVTGIELANGEKIRCRRVISNLMPTVVFDRMIEHDKIPERDLRAMNARELAQSAFTIYLGLDATKEELGIKGYDTFVRSDSDPAKQYESARTIETHGDYCVTILNEAIPDCSPEGTCIVQFSKFYSDDAFKDVTEEEYFKLKDRIAQETIEHYEKTFNVNLHDHIEEIVISSPVTWARYIGTPRGDVYGYVPKTWDGMFPRVQSGHHLDYTIKGLRFCGGHGTQMDGYSQAILSGEEQARYTLEDMEVE